MPGPVPRILAGFVNWNQREEALVCLELLRKGRDSRFELEMAVVDNGSSDGSGQIIQEKFPEVKVILNKTNRGAAGGRNDLFDYFLSTAADYLMILDPDVSIRPGFFSALLEEIQRAPDIGCIGVKAYYADQPDIFWFKGGALYNPWLGQFEKSGQKEKDTGQYEHSEEIHAIPAGFTFAKREVIEKFPRMDERYFIYFEESDWNFKIRRADYRLVTSEKARCIHKVSQSLGMESPFFYYYRTRNNLLFAVRNSPVYCLPVFFLYYFFYRTPDILLTLWLSKRPKQIQGVLLGILDFFRGRFGRCPYSNLRNATLKGDQNDDSNRIADGSQM